MTDYNSKTKIELVALCKEKGIKGYAQIGITKEKIIQLLTGEIEYNDPRKKENWSEKKKDSFEKTRPECTNKLSFKNKIPVCVNGITYTSITDCCTKLNISRTTLYTNIRSNNIDITDPTNIVHIIIMLLHKKET